MQNLTPSDFCTDIQQIGTLQGLISKSDLPNELKAALLNHVKMFLPKYRSEVHSSLHKALDSIDFRANNIVRGLIYSEAINRGFNPDSVTICGYKYTP